MDVSLQLVSGVAIFLYFRVSILVLMDVSLQQKLDIEYVVKLIGFNPCFNGCLSSTPFFTSYPGKGRKVSILVLMDVSLQH